MATVALVIRAMFWCLDPLVKYIQCEYILGVGSFLLVTWIWVWTMAMLLLCTYSVGGVLDYFGENFHTQIQVLSSSEFQKTDSSVFRSLSSITWDLSLRERGADLWLSASNDISRSCNSWYLYHMAVQSLSKAEGFNMIAITKRK